MKILIFSDTNETAHLINIKVQYIQTYIYLVFGILISGIWE